MTNTWIQPNAFFKFTSIYYSIYTFYKYFFLIWNKLIYILFKFYMSLGDFEIFFAASSVTVLGFIIYNVITSFSFRDLLKRFGFLKISRRDFYECGFRPITQKTIRLPIQFILICIFFLLYDIELIFLFPYVSGITFIGFFDTLLILFFFFIFFLSLVIDFNRHALVWQY